MKSDLNTTTIKNFIFLSNLKCKLSKSVFLFLFVIIFSITSPSKSYISDEPIICNWTNLKPTYTTSIAITEPLKDAIPFMNVSYHLMAYDTESDRVLWFGGEFEVFPWLTWPEIFENLHNRSWIGAYDYEANEWEILFKNGSEPIGHVGGAGDMVYDIESDRIIVFGGIVGENFESSNETWAFDYNSNSWTNLIPSTSPSARFFHRMAYDSESGKTILFGGDSHFVQTFNDTWAFDFNSNTWTNMNPSQSPLGFANHGMAYDAESDRVILFFGKNVSSETWAYDYNLNAWTNMNPSTTPPPLHAPSMAYDTESDRVILVGGTDIEEASSKSETWSYDYNNNTWTKLNPSSSPSARFQASMVYNSKSDTMILFGGWGSNETWKFECKNCDLLSSEPKKTSLSYSPIIMAGIILAIPVIINRKKVK